MEKFNVWCARISKEAMAVDFETIEHFLMVKIGERQILYGDQAFVDEPTPNLVGIMPSMEPIAKLPPHTPPVAESWRAIGNRKLRVK